ncbi:MAG TPA: ATP-binding protein [Devosia sp.]|nr:ATP-binding protein [Devosia sp.]
MADETKTAAPANPFAHWRGRLVARVPLLAAMLFVIVALMGFRQLDFVPALIAALAVIVFALVLPGEEIDLEETPAGAAQALADAGLQHFADALPDPCLILNERSIVTYRNSPAEAQFPGIAPGAPIALSMRAPAMLSAIEAARATGAPQAVELHQTLPTETWHRATVAPLVAGKGDGHLIITLRSLTDEKRLEALRTDFVANASHELRTPLTSLLGFIDTLLGPAQKDPEAQQKFLGIMRNQAVRMSKLIEDLLSLSRIEMRQHLRPTGTVDLGLLLREVREGLSGQAGEAGVTVEIALPEAPVTVTGDRDELYEVFENLTDNAIKYGAKGGKVDIALAAVSNRPGFGALVSVTDYGDGVEAEHVPRLTERFYRVDVESSRRKKGTGLGLAIVKHIINRHRGQMSIRSRPGHGTRVEVLLAS